MTCIELLFFILAVVMGIVTANYAYAAWGMWGGVGGFIVGALSPWGVSQVILMLAPHKLPRCECGKCGVDDFVYERHVDGQSIQVYACGRMYRWGDDGQRHLLTKIPEGDADKQPLE